VLAPEVLGVFAQGLNSLATDCAEVVTDGHVGGGGASRGVVRGFDDELEVDSRIKGVR
jgi:hypothetical protein